MAKAPPVPVAARVRRHGWRSRGRPFGTVVRVTGQPLTNWAGNVTFSTDRVCRPTSVEQVQELVAEAEREGRRVRPFGSRHSFNRIADPGDHGVLVDLSALASCEIDEDGAVWIGSGVRYAELAPQLRAAGRALRNLPSLPHVTVCGAVATATHGSGVRNRGLADAIDAVEVVTADGELRTIERGDGDFRGAVVSLGALGVVTRLRLTTEPTYDVAQTVYRGLPIRLATEHLDEIMALGHSVSLFTDWHSGTVDQVWLKCRPDRDPVAPRDVFGARPATAACHPLPGGPVEACTEQLGRPGPWHERLPHFRADAVPSTGDELQSEYFVDRVHGAAAMAAVAAVGDAFSPLLLVSEVRTVAADDQWLSPTADTAKLALHFTWRRDQPGVEAVLPELEAALAPFDPRPHWGKLTTLPPEIVRARSPHLADFVTLAERADPQGTFRNQMLDSLLTPTPMP